MRTLFNLFFLAFLARFYPLHLVHGQISQQGFISIDCGSNSSYVEPISGLNYVSDSSFVDTGLVKSISSSYTLNGLMKQLWNLRSFPEGTRNCYTIQVEFGTKYLIRSSFLYGNYDGKNSIPEFNLYFGTNFWTTVSLPKAQTIIDEEIIHIAMTNQVQVCLVNTGNGTPFISSLELRPLPNTIYETKSGSLMNFLRLDIGTNNNASIRYPDDDYDRIWKPPTPVSVSGWVPISTSSEIGNNDGKGFKAPSSVLKTASTVANESAPMIIPWGDPDRSNQFYVYFYFAELQTLLANQSRTFKIFFNNNPFYSMDVSPRKDKVDVIYSDGPLSMNAVYEFNLIRSQGSTLPPIFNALEVFKVMNFDQPTTDKGDVDAIESIMKAFEVKKEDWQGDPCVPKALAWGALICTYDESNPPKITSLNLSSSGLTGEIRETITNLTMLKVLDLSNNSLSGSVPDFLATMPLLTVINLSGNNLSGQIPAALIDKRNRGTLSLSVEGNMNLQEITPSEKKKNNIVAPVVAAIGGAMIILALILAYVCFIRRKRSPKGSTTVDPHSPINSQVELRPHEPLHTPSRQLTFSDIRKMTNNFGRLLGEGGFGKVYYGLMNDTEVAVKMLSPESTQGYREFQTEVDLLMRVHHKNLTSLVGYCNEGETKMGLVYEYMGKGNLGSIILDGREVLRWEDRLQIALDSAQGLEYLHNGCRPPIIHRDIKSSNILLNKYLEAKLADFGLSRAFPGAGSATHVTTRVVGTPGYLDPEYFTSFKLTEKSDVYSFGIVILELITGRPVLVKNSEKSHIIQWVDSIINQGDIYSIIDPKIKEDCNTNSVWKAVDIGMSCTASKAIDRPTMSQIVSKLKECINLELNQRGHQLDLGTTMSSTFHSEMGPMAR